MTNLNFWICTLVIAFALHAQADRSNLAFRSALRLENEDWQDGFKRLEREHIRIHGYGFQRYDKNAQEMAINVHDLDTSILPEWQPQELQRNFEYVRDLRFLFEKNKEDFPRRISWLYPDDGCFARAAKAIHKLEDAGIKTPLKAFIFGNLRVKTPNAPNGKIGWMYHVVPIVQVQGQPFVLDPAINPKEPLKLVDWVLNMVKNDKDARVSICDAGTYTPDQACRASKPTDDDDADEDQIIYLSYEWQRVEHLDRDPVKELGDEPPWLRPLRLNPRSPFVQ